MSHDTINSLRLRRLLYTQGMSADLALPAHLDVMGQAQRLARPVTFLRPSGEGAPVALWGGTPSVPLPPELVVTDEDDLEDGAFFDHWLSIDARRLPVPLPGCLSLYEQSVEPLLLHNPEATLDMSGGTPLYAHPGIELPHINALFRSGTPALQAWMAELLGETPAALLARSDIGAYRHPTLDGLDQRLRSAHPLWAGGVTAQLGGWAWGWPDEAWDTRESRGERLLLTTFERSEPWIEVWWTERGLAGVAHLT
ncbi:hypothetical protein GCM10010844_39550 [Deinococcus radiotolerans]|uniref:Uncharacterized protein n=2 Tax=Deinococcus radiotolerans TaxID=1309407 RepID=A0ABQ2FQH5_9DEIO|nr:hypothetical protein GCM10010844_39550 [Deinococcus radiotolerans]